MVKENKFILSLKDILPIMSVALGGSEGNKVFLTMSNLDNVFIILRKKGIKEVKVSVEEMLMIVLFVIANTNKDEYEDLNWKAIKILQEGKINKFLGVKLVLDE